MLQFEIIFKRVINVTFLPDSSSKDRIISKNLVRKSMFKLRKLFYLSLFLIFAYPLFAQSFNNNYHNHWRDWDDWDKWGFEFEYDRPFIEINYGLGKLQHNNFNTDFSKSGLMELKLGYLKESSFYYDNIDDRKESFAFGSKIGTALQSEDAAADEFQSTVWRFGIATRNTLGYYWDDVSLLPYHQDGFAWSRLESDDFNYQSQSLEVLIGLLTPDELNDYKIVERYRDTFRFGTVAEGGIRIEFAETVSLNAGYEAAVIFPRHLFWKHAGSYLIEKAGQGALTYFIDEIMDSSPVAGPIVNFLLQNGYSYAFYLLKKEDMNWPFSTETPLTFETFKFGVTFTF